MLVPPGRTHQDQGNRPNGGRMTRTDRWAKATTAPTFSAIDITTTTFSALSDGNGWG